jgi:hypothetical protein
MHVFEVSFYFAGVYYALFHKQELLLPFFVIIAIYFLLGYFVQGARDISIRKKIMLATWSEPEIGNAFVRFSFRVDRILQLI